MRKTRWTEELGKAYFGRIDVNENKLIEEDEFYKFFEQSLLVCEMSDKRFDKLIDKYMKAATAELKEAQADAAASNHMVVNPAKAVSSQDNQFGGVPVRSESPVQQRIRAAKQKERENSPPVRRRSVSKPNAFAAKDTLPPVRRRSVSKLNAFAAMDTSPPVRRKSVSKPNPFAAATSQAADDLVSDPFA